MKFLSLVLACTFCPVALAAPPLAPHLTVEATDIRQLEFNYEPVPGVASYELWFRAASGAQWVKYQEHAAQRAPLFRIGVAVHLLDWRQARYHVKACNPSGCTPSNEVGVDGLQLVAMGYIKPNVPIRQKHFGSTVAVSADGKTVAALASENVGGQQRSVTVHVYRRNNAIGDWRREARLLPSTSQRDTNQPLVGDPLAISGDGNLIVLGAWMERMDGRQASDGAVYLFRRSGTTWRQAQKLTFPSEVANELGDQFGYSVKVDDAGRMLVVSHRYVDDRSEPSTLEIYRDPDDASDQFVHTGTVPTSLDGRCSGGIALSGDGLTMLRGCFGDLTEYNFVQVLKGPDFAERGHLTHVYPEGMDLSFDGTQAIVQYDGHAEGWELTSGGWVPNGTISAINTYDYRQRRWVAISRDGKIAAVGNSSEYTLGVGPTYPPYVAGDMLSGSGGVAIAERKSSGWVLRRLIKPGSTHEASAGNSVALGDNGRILAVGAPFDPSGAAGIDGDRNDASSPETGAVWIY